MKIHTTLVLIIIIFATTLVVTAFTTDDTGSQVAVFEINYGLKKDARIVISEGAEHVSVIQLESTHQDNMETNAKTISKALNEMYAKGYHVVAGDYNRYILEK